MTAETLCVPPHFNSTCSLSPKLTTTLNLAFSLFMFLIPIQSQFTYNTSKNSSPSPWYTFYSCGCYTLKNTNLLPHCFLIRKPWIQKKKKKALDHLTSSDPLMKWSFSSPDLFSLQQTSINFLKMGQIVNTARIVWSQAKQWKKLWLFHDL